MTRIKIPRRDIGGVLLLNGKPEVKSDAAQEAEELLRDAAQVIAGTLAKGIATLGYPVGMGLAPHPDACLAAATKIVERFRGATLAALEGEAAIAELADIKARETALRATLKTAVSHIEHMAAWITSKNAGYSFESLGEDMPGLYAALAIDATTPPSAP